MATELLPGYGYPDTWEGKRALRKVSKKRRRCKLIGHLFTAVTHDSSTGRTVLRCDRCFPHKDSQRVGYLYDLMPVIEEG